MNYDDEGSCPECLSQDLLIDGEEAICLECEWTGSEANVLSPVARKAEIRARRYDDRANEED